MTTTVEMFTSGPSDPHGTWTRIETRADRLNLAVNALFRLVADEGGLDNLHPSLSSASLFADPTNNRVLVGDAVFAQAPGRTSEIEAAIKRRLPASCRVDVKLMTPAETAAYRATLT